MSASPEATLPGLSASALDPCPTCGAPAMARYCAVCGERRPRPDDLSLHRFLLAAIEQVTSLDATLPRTLRLLIGRPGQLTLDYVEGRRRANLRPIQLFLIVNLAFFLASAATGADTLSTRLQTHLHQLPHSPIVRPLVEREVAARSVSLAEYEAAFDTRVRTQAQSLVIVMVPAFAGLLALLLLRSRRWFGEHLVFALHFYAVFLLLLIGYGLLLFLVLGGFRALGRPWPFGWRVLDEGVVWYLLFFGTLYLRSALRRVYGLERSTSLLVGLLLAFASLVLVQAYRAALFFTTFYSL